MHPNLPSGELIRIPYRSCCASFHGVSQLCRKKIFAAPLLKLRRKSLVFPTFNEHIFTHLPRFQCRPNSSFDML